MSTPCPVRTADFDDFLAGRPVAARTLENSWWLANVAASRAADKYIGRVRLVGHPITAYTRFECDSYPENIAAGEEVRVLDRKWLGPDDAAWTHQDFWLFDDEIAVLQHYDSTGRFLGVERAGDVAPFVEIMTRAMRLSVPFGEYQLVPGLRRPAQPPLERPSGCS